MVPQKSGTIINVSSLGGHFYFMNPAYGAGKAGTDKMAHDCAQELRKHNVTMVSFWPGPVRTEAIMENVLGNSTKQYNIGAQIGGLTIGVLPIRDSIIVRGTPPVKAYNIPPSVQDQKIPPGRYF